MKTQQIQEIQFFFRSLERKALSFKLQNGALMYLDQRSLPLGADWFEISKLDEAISALQNLAIRGAPLIGVAAGLVLAKQAVEMLNELDFEEDSAQSSTKFKADLFRVAKVLREARPTAINLMNSIDACLTAFSVHEDLFEGVRALINLAVAQFDEDVRACARMAEAGVQKVTDGDGVLTICNTGGLATVGGGTALNVIKSAWKKYKQLSVYVCETRPLLQGARLTCWELNEAQIPFTLICDSMAGFLMQQKKVQKIFIGADRITQGGDVVNKIGSYALAVLAKHHQIPFFVVAPKSTFSQDLDARQIPIEERAQSEVLGKNWNLPYGQAWNPAFDIISRELITEIITD